MTTSPSIGGPRSWRSTALVALVVLTPPLTQGLLSDDRQFLNTAASADGLTVAPAALLAAVCLYTSWRLSAAASLSWLVASLTLVGVQSLAFGAFKVTAGVQTAEQHGWMALADLVLLAVLLTFRRYDGRGLLALSPVGLGAGVGVLIGLGRALAVAGLPSFEPTPPLRLLFAVAGISMVGLLSRHLLRGGGLPHWVRVRFVSAIVLLCAAHMITWVDGAVRDPASTLVALVCTVLAAAALASAGLGTLRLTVADDLRRSSTMLEEFEQARVDQRRHRERLHELESTIAGIRSAGELLRDPARIDPERRRQLEEMIHSEVCRLERLLSSGSVSMPPEPPARGAPAPPSPSSPPSPPSPAVDLDDTIATLALLHEAKGTTVRWQRSGRKVRAPADDIAEVLNILLDNAARHGDATAAVEVLDVGSTIEILVSDNGPGVAPEVRDRLFQWGARGPASPGHGIGLHIASSLVSGHGGYLEVRDASASRRGGATFAVGLPAATPAERSSSPRRRPAGLAATARQSDGVLA